MTQQMAVLTMTDYKDADFYLITLEDAEWAYAPNYDMPPEHMIQALNVAWGEEEDDPDHWQASYLAGKQDKTHLVATAYLDIKPGYFGSIAQLMKYCKENDIEVVKDIEGRWY